MVYPGQHHYTDYSSKVNRQPIDDFGRRLRVVCVGAGISGITSAIRFNQHLGQHIDFKIYEKNEGTVPNVKRLEEVTDSVGRLANRVDQTLVVSGSRTGTQESPATFLRPVSPGLSRTTQIGRVITPAVRRSTIT
jgi:hypothetical protein